MPDYTQYPSVSLDPNVPVKVTLSFDDFRSGTKNRDDGTSYTWYKYGVSVNGKIHNLWPHSDVHRIIQGKGYKKGDVLTLEKHVRDNETWYTVNGEKLDDASPKEAPAEYYDGNAPLEPKSTGGASSEMLPMIERMIKDVNALSKDLEYIQGYFELQKPAPKPLEDGIPF